MMELEQLIRYRDYWSQKLNQVVDAEGGYRDRCYSDSSPVSVSGSASSDQGFYDVVCTYEVAGCVAARDVQFAATQH